MTLSVKHVFFFFFCFFFYDLFHFSTSMSNIIQHSLNMFLTFTTLWTNFGRRQIEIFCCFFSPKYTFWVLTFHANCLQRKETICMKYQRQFSEKKKKKKKKKKKTDKEFKIYSAKIFTQHDKHYYLFPNLSNHLNKFILSLRKHAYSNLLKISPPKTESFQRKILIFFIFLLKT